MKNTLRTIFSLSVIAAFVILNWATSQEVEFRELNAEATIFQDSMIILKNLDDLDVTDAELALLAPESENFKQYYILNYFLPSNTSDTIFTDEFMDVDSLSYPSNLPPSNLILNFLTTENTGESQISFSTEL